MTVVIIVLSCLCSYFALHLFVLRKSVRRLTKDFKEASENIEAEQHVHITSPSRELELLAVQLNDNMVRYFKQRYSYEKAMKAIRNEITNLSHDLRTPITSILGYLDFIEGENLPEDQIESLEIVKRRSNDLNNLVEQLYEYARLESEDCMIKAEKIDLYKTLNEHLLSFYPEFEHEGISLELQLPNREKPIWVIGDLNCLDRVFTNLTSNAIKYSKGSVFISLKCEKNLVHITYRTFRGELTEYDISHLFDRFYKKDKTRGRTKSSGLGLTIAKIYIEQMKGRIEAWGDKDYLYVSCCLPEVEIG